MKRLLLILTLTLSALASTAQELSTEQAIDYANKLYEVRILSVAGRDTLINRIRENRLKRERIQVFAYTVTIYTKSSVANILNFCQEAFAAEYYYRLGMEEMWKEKTKVLGETEKNGGWTVYPPLSAIPGDSTLSQEDLKKQVKKMEKYLKKLQKEMIKADKRAWRKYKKYKGPKIESAVVARDSIMPITMSSPPGFPAPEEWGKSGLIHPQRSAIGKTWTLTADDLLALGLIDKDLYREVLEEMQEKYPKLEASVLEFLAWKIALKEDFKDMKAEEHLFLNKLQKWQLLGGRQYLNLAGETTKDSLLELFDIVPYCNHTVMVDLSPERKTGNLETYSYMFGRIREIIPGLDYKNLKLETIPDEVFNDHSFTVQNARLSFEVNGKEYAQTFYYNSWSGEQEKTDEPGMISWEFYKGINRFLANTHSDKRLHLITDNWSDIHSAGFILLNKDQYDSLSSTVTYISQENYDAPFLSSRIDSMLIEYREIGLFSHLSHEELKAGKKKLAERDIQQAGDVLLCFPRTIVYFDWETGNLENPYEELLKQLAGASRGAFQVSAIKDDFGQSLTKKKKTSLLSFELNGKKYEKELEIMDDWLAPAFMIMIQEALADQKIDGQIYGCANDGQAGGYIFLTQAQHDYLVLKQPGLIIE